MQLQGLWQKIRGWPSQAWQRWSFILSPAAWLRGAWKSIKAVFRSPLKLRDAIGMYPGISMIVGLLMLAAPFATWGFATVKAKIDIASAVAAAKSQAAAQCKVELAKVDTASRQAAITFREGAAAPIAPIPEDKSALKKLCDNSASCRDRTKRAR